MGWLNMTDKSALEMIPKLLFYLMAEISLCCSSFDVYLRIDEDDFWYAYLTVL